VPGPAAAPRRAGALDIGHPLAEQPGQARQAIEQELAALGQDLFSKGVVALQVIAQHGGVPSRELPAPALRPTCPGVQLTVLFRLAVLRRAEYRRHGQRRVPRRDVTEARAMWS